MRVLAGDIGGTKTALAVFEVEGRQLTLRQHETYPSRAYGSLDQILRLFAGKLDAACEYAAFGVAGPVRGGRCETTNLPWRLDAEALAVDNRYRRVWLINDLEANAWGIGALGAEDIHTLDPGTGDGQGNASIVSAGTGLGEAGLFWDGRRHHPFASEGGHADFAPASDLEIALLHYLQALYGHVSWERVVSGAGLVDLYRFLVTYRQAASPDWLTQEMSEGDPAAAISGAALAGRCPLCNEALDLFVHLYGVEAGNHALKVMATGGVYLGGGIAPKILPRLQTGLFIQGFRAKGRMEPLMREMPVRVILNERTALYGPALYAAAQLQDAE